MNFTSQICTTKEQSERLLSLGLKKETADMCLHTSYRVSYTFSYKETLVFFECKGLDKFRETKSLFPAWSLHRLIEIFKKGINISEYLVCSNAYNEIIDDIEYEIKEGHFNKEYLEE